MLFNFTNNEENHFTPNLDTKLKIRELKNISPKSFSYKRVNSVLKVSLTSIEGHFPPTVLQRLMAEISLLSLTIRSPMWTITVKADAWREACQLGSGKRNSQKPT